jgi:hypothetical protein
LGPRGNSERFFPLCDEFVTARRSTDILPDAALLPSLQVRGRPRRRSAYGMRMPPVSNASVDVTDNEFLYHLVPLASDFRGSQLTQKWLVQAKSQLWEWIVWSNPIVEGILGDLGVSGDERVTIEEALDRLVRERAGGSESAVLTNPINIGIGTK